MVAYLKAGLQVRTYWDYLRAAREAKKEDSIGLPQDPRTQTADGPPKPRTTSFFPLRKRKGNQPLLKKPAVHLAHLEEEDTGNDENPESDDPSGIKGVTEEFWFVWQGWWKTPKQMRNAVTIVAAQNISSAIAHL